MADYDPHKVAREIVASVLPAPVQAQFALELVMCPDCGVNYAVSVALAALRSGQQDDDSGGLYCPNGHKWWWQQSLSAMIESQVSKASEALGGPPGAVGVKRLQRELAQVRHDREQLEAELSAVKAAGDRRGSGKVPKRQARQNPRRGGGPGEQSRRSES